MKYIYSAFFLCLAISLVNVSNAEEKDAKIATGRIESCPGCSLNRLKEVKQFIYDDLPNYENIYFLKIHGAKPELVLLNAADEEIERIPLSELSREQCNELLVSKGFKLKQDNNVKSEF